jgi:CRP-like cAMP-binding protein
MHAKAKRVTNNEMNTQMEDMSLQKQRPQLNRGGSNSNAATNSSSNNAEPTTAILSQRHLLSMGKKKSKNAVQRYDNIYAIHQSMVGSFIAPVYEKTDEEVEFLLDALSDNFVFNTLDEVELETLVNAFEFVQYTPQTTIIHQGEYGGYFYILSYGTVAFMVNGIEVGRASCGNSFGELALLYNAPRAATCIVVSDDTNDNSNNSNNNGGGAGLWRVDQVTFRKLLAAHTIQNDNQTKVVLRKVPFLSDLDDEFIHRIADALTTVYYDAGDTIFSRGSEGSVFYVIREGKVQYEHYKRGIKTLRPGDYFGEQAIVKNEVRRATATAMKDTIALALSRDIFERVLGPLSDVIQRSNDRRLLRNVPLFANSDIQSFEIELMGALIDDVKYPAEKEILSEGDYVDVPALYLVRSGVLEAYTDAGESRILKTGMYFGEDTLLPDKDLKYGGKGGLKQSAVSVEVLEDCVLGKLTLANIDSVILDLSRMGGGKRGRDTLQRSIDITKLIRHTLLGAGTFGQVWLTSDKKTGNAYALKVQIKRELIDHKQAEGVCRELDVMRKIDHPFIIKLVNTSQDEQSVFMLLNLVQGGELFNIMHNDDRDCIPENEVQFYAAGILEALAYMHRRRIIYRDLKPENVLIDDLGYTVIVDLGFAKVVSDKTYTLCGTPLCK